MSQLSSNSTASVSHSPKKTTPKKERADDVGTLYTKHQTRPIK
jgi:hypothetical protein